MKKKASLIFLLTVVFSMPVFSKKKKRQVIDLEGANIDGEVRTPSGDYVLQKSGVDFLPLYEKKKVMTDEIKKTVHFLR